jgi:hypothetical protein
MSNGQSAFLRRLEAASIHDLLGHYRVESSRALAEMGEALGRAGVSIEDGGVFAGAAHFLFADGAAARVALERAGIRVVAEHEVLEPAWICPRCLHRPGA